MTWTVRSITETVWCPECGSLSPGFRKELEELTRFLVIRNEGARKLMLRICPDRLHTILPGALLLHQTAERLGVSQLYISKYGGYGRDICAGSF